jgi:hypothetical protein
MAKKIAAYNTNSVVGAPIRAASASVILQGVFVGLNTSGQILPAECKSTAIPARGAALQDAQMKDPKGNVLDTIEQGSYTFEGKISGLSGLTSGATYYLLSGGAIQVTAPATTTGDIDQEVGYALDDSTLVIKIGPAVIHA